MKKTIKNIIKILALSVLGMGALIIIPFTVFGDAPEDGVCIKDHDNECYSYCSLQYSDYQLENESGFFCSSNALGSLYFMGTDNKITVDFTELVANKFKPSGFEFMRDEYTNDVVSLFFNNSDDPTLSAFSPDKKYVYIEMDRLSVGPSSSGPSITCFVDVEKLSQLNRDFLRCPFAAFKVEYPEKLPKEVKEVLEGDIFLRSWNDNGLVYFHELTWYDTVFDYYYALDFYSDNVKRNIVNEIWYDLKTENIVKKRKKKSE